MDRSGEVPDELLHPDPRVRLRAVEALARLRAPGAVGWLLWALQDEDEQVRWTAAHALGRGGDARSAAELVAAFQLWDSHVHKQCQEALIALGEAAVPALTGGLKHPNRRVRVGAATVLGRNCDARAVPALREMLGDPDQHLVTLAAEALGRMRDPAAVEPLCELLIRGNGGAATALGLIGDPRAVPALCKALRSDDRRTLARAARALALIAGRQPMRELRQALPLLRRHSSPWHLEGEDVWRACQEAIAAIEAATASYRDLPLAASAPDPSLETLPIPAEAGAHALEPARPALPPEAASGKTTRLRLALRRLWGRLLRGRSGGD